MELLGKRKKDRMQRKFMDVMKEDMQKVDVTEENAGDRMR